MRTKKKDTLDNPVIIPTGIATYHPSASPTWPPANFAKYLREIVKPFGRKVTKAEVLAKIEEQEGEEAVAWIKEHKKTISFDVWSACKQLNFTSESTSTKTNHIADEAMNTTPEDLLAAIPIVKELVKEFGKDANKRIEEIAKLIVTFRGVENVKKLVESFN
jgi:hypothetical protein